MSARKKKSEEANTRIGQKTLDQCPDLPEGGTGEPKGKATIKLTGKIEKRLKTGTTNTRWDTSPDTQAKDTLKFFGKLGGNLRGEKRNLIP